MGVELFIDLIGYAITWKNTQQTILLLYGRTLYRLVRRHKINRPVNDNEIR